MLKITPQLWQIWHLKYIRGPQKCEKPILHTTHPDGCFHIVTCQAHPALVKFQFLDPWPMSRRCLEPRWFVGDPT